VLSHMTTLCDRWMKFVHSLAMRASLSARTWPYSPHVTNTSAGKRGQCTNDATFHHISRNGAMCWCFWSSNAAGARLVHTGVNWRTRDKKLQGETFQEDIFFIFWPNQVPKEPN
jgi:hypothetical protein